MEEALVSEDDVQEWLAALADTDDYGPRVQAGAKSALVTFNQMRVVVKAARKAAETNNDYDISDVANAVRALDEGSV